MKLGTSSIVVVVAAAAVWMASTAVNQAQTAAGETPCCGTKVAVVDLEKVFDQFEQTQVLNRKMDAIRKKFTQERESKQQAIQAEQVALEAFAKDSTEYYKRNKDLKKKVLEYRIWEAMTNDEVAQNYRRWVNRTYKMITEAVATTAKADGVKLVITQEQLKTDVKDPKELIARIISRKVVYTAPSIDLTEKVRSKLNADFQKAGGPDAVEFMKP